jgi:hypothetical protein
MRKSSGQLIQVAQIIYGESFHKKSSGGLNSLRKIKTFLPISRSGYGKQLDGWDGFRRGRFTCHLAELDFPILDFNLDRISVSKPPAQKGI